MALRNGDATELYSRYLKQEVLIREREAAKTEQNEMIRRIRKELEEEKERSAEEMDRSTVGKSNPRSGSLTGSLPGHQK